MAIFHDMRSISAGKFKDTCLRVLDEVAATRTPVVITKWNRPVARLTPLLAPLPPPDEEATADSVQEPLAPYGVSERGGGLEAAASRLHRVASQLGMSPEGLLHQALDIYDGDRALDELIERAKEPVGAFRSDCKDLAEKHDEAYVEILEEEMERWRLPRRRDSE